MLKQTAFEDLILISDRRLGWGLLFCNKSQNFVKIFQSMDLSSTIVVKAPHLRLEARTPLTT